ncbi:MAG: class I SAM-dependent methyltransferase [Chlorobium sp.]
MADHYDSSKGEPPSNWFVEWFNHPLYLEVYSHRDQEEALHCIDTILSQSGLCHKSPASLTVLDIACGAGRHALELARLGCQVTGNDLSPFLLEEARKAALKINLLLKLTCCDMRKIQDNLIYDLIVQLFTSFGYFDGQEDDQLVLQRVHHALHHGGWYVLDLINPSYLIRNLVAHSSRTAGVLAIIEDRAIKNDRITKSISIVPPQGKPLNFTESVRLYSKDEICGMLQQSGLTVQSISGNYHGDTFEEEESPRMMIFCQKM